MGTYQTLGFSMFVRKLRDGLNERITQFEEANAISQIEVQKSTQEWMEFYSNWAKVNNRDDLLNLVTAYLNNSDEGPVE